ncbi:MAG: BatD family protein, partial [Rhizobiaceae bacterium]|nr:BatD family protein [Rhizobiaceae bacterium]
MTRRLLAILVLLLLAASPSFAAEPFARATIDDKGVIVPGQQVHMTVVVFAPDFFTSPPQFPLFDIPNAVVTLPDERAQNSLQTVDGTQYSGISRTYAIVPQASGTFALPPITIELGYSDNGKPVKGKAQLPSISFTVGQASGDNAASPVFAARGLVLTQAFDSDPGKLRAGDAIVRTITVFAT